MMRKCAGVMALVLAACSRVEQPPTIDSVVVRDSGVSAPRRLGFAALADTSCVTRADSLDTRYIAAKFDTLATANGVGARRNMATAGRARTLAQLARLTSQPACGSGGTVDTLVRVDTFTVTKTVTRVDTFTVTKTVTRTDTLRVNTAVDTALVRRMRVNLDSIDNDATAPAYSLRNQKVLAARVDTVARGSAVTPPPPVDTVIPKPPLPPVVVDTGAVAKIAGPYLTSAQQIALGAPFAEYDAQFARWDDMHWGFYLDGSVPVEGFFYYDRGFAYYVRWKQTGDVKYRLRADSVTRDYRRRYIEANGYLIAPWQGFADGLAVHYLLTGDTASRTAVAKMADYFVWYIGASTADERVKGYTIRALLDAHLIGAKSVGLGAPAGIPAAGDWPTALRATLNKILATQRADGSWPGGPCGGLDHPFTVGLLLEQLARYHDRFEADPRIVTAIRRSVDYLWLKDWISTANAFKYISAECAGEGGPTPAPILNGLIWNAYAWTYRMTGDATYKTRATAMVLGSVASGEAGNSNPKMFSQQFATGWRGIAWLAR